MKSYALLATLIAIGMNLGIPSNSIAADEPAALPKQSKIRIAVDGYCIVSAIEAKLWVKGEENIFSDFKGSRYIFLSKDEKKLFDADPVQFALIFGGNDPIETIENNKEVIGSRFYALRNQNRTLFFANDTNRKKFDSMAQHYTELLQAIEDIETRTQRLETQRGKGVE